MALRGGALPRRGATRDDLREAVTTFEDTDGSPARVLGGAHPQTAAMGIEPSRASSAREARARETPAVIGMPRVSQRKKNTKQIGHTNRPVARVRASVSTLNSTDVLATVEAVGGAGIASRPSGSPAAHQVRSRARHASRSGGDPIRATTTLLTSSSVGSQIRMSSKTARKSTIAFENAFSERATMLTNAHAAGPQSSLHLLQVGRF